MRNTNRNATYIFGGIFLLIFLIWEMLNYWTTEQGLSMMMGINPLAPDWWIRSFAIGMVAMDVLHLAIFFYARLSPGVLPAEIDVFSWIAWAVVTFLDVFLSVYTFGFTFEQGVANGTTRGPQVFSEFLKYGPLAISLGMWGMTIFSITMGRSFIAAALGIAPPPPRPRPQAGGGGNRQPNPPQQNNRPQFKPNPQSPHQAAPRPTRGGSEEVLDPETQAILDGFKSKGGFHTIQ